jgi:hypothetical protein
VSFNLDLYRAPEGLGPWSTWTEMHARPLGTRAGVQARLDAVLHPIRWAVSDAGAYASYAYDDAGLPREIQLTGAEDETLVDISVHSGPPAIRVHMTALGLSYCYAPESDELYRPFEPVSGGRLRLPADDSGRSRTAARPVPDSSRCRPLSIRNVYSAVPVSRRRARRIASSSAARRPGCVTGASST